MPEKETDTNEYAKGRGLGFGRRFGYVPGDIPDYQNQEDASLPRAGIGRGRGGLGRGPCAYLIEQAMKKKPGIELTSEEQKQILEARLKEIEQEKKGIEERLKKL